MYLAIIKPVIIVQSRIATESTTLKCNDSRALHPKSLDLHTLWHPYRSNQRFWLATGIPLNARFVLQHKMPCYPTFVRLRTLGRTVGVDNCTPNNDRLMRLLRMGRSFESNETTMSRWGMVTTANMKLFPLYWVSWYEPLAQRQVAIRRSDKQQRRG